MRVILDIETVVKMYGDGHGTSYIAKKMKTSPGTINKLLKGCGQTIRSRAESQKLALEKGFVPHPTEGKTRTAAVKNKISQKMAEKWDSYTDEQLEERSKLSKKVWDGMTKDQKELFRKKSIEAIKDSAKYGSKLEKFILSGLRREKYTVLFHVNNLVENNKLQVDMYIPSLRLVIEIDGPSHSIPIWGDEALQKTRRADAEKNGLLISLGYKVLRLSVPYNDVTEKIKKEALSAILKSIELLECNRIVEDLIQVEVSFGRDA